MYLHTRLILKEGNSSSRVSLACWPELANERRSVDQNGGKSILQTSGRFDRFCSRLLIWMRGEKKSHILIFHFLKVGSIQSSVSLSIRPSSTCWTINCSLFPFACSSIKSFTVCQHNPLVWIIHLLVCPSLIFLFVFFTYTVVHLSPSLSIPPLIQSRV